MLKVLRLLAYSTGVPEALDKNDPENLRSLTFGISLNNQTQAVEFLDINGNRILSVNHRTGENIENYDLDNQNNMKILEDKALARKMGELGLARVSANYSLDSMLNRILALYQEQMELYASRTHLAGF